jgi:hypothetical protein
MPHRLPSFWIKAMLLVGLVAAADALVLETRPGAGFGVFALATLAALALTNPAARTNRLALAALVPATFFGVLQIERATLLGLLLFAVALAVAALAPRAKGAEDAARWAARLIAAGFKAVIGPYWDLRTLLKARARGRRLRFTAVVMAAVLPVLGGALFLWLFGVANPVISASLALLRLPEPDVGRVVFWGAAAGAVWAVLRPRGLRWRGLRISTGGPVGPTVTAGSVAVSLVVFNAIFALQNGLDIVFLWRGAALPQGVTFAEYAHRGAYPLIATALLAGLFVLVFLRPGTPGAEAPLVRRLVVVWVAQNVFLVASTALRTLDYIDAYSLTRMRVAALIWMALVALGLVLICWRLIFRRSASWLINANVLAAGVVLAACSVVDLGAAAAAWNIRHAREVGGRGAGLDLDYLATLDGAALVSLAELQRRPLEPGLRRRADCVLRREILDASRSQSDWREWRWRDARRLARVEEILGPSPNPAAAARQACDRPAAASVAAPVLTPPPGAGT